MENMEEKVEKKMTENAEELSMETLEKAAGGTTLTGEEKERELIRLDLRFLRQEGTKPKTALMYIKTKHPPVMTDEEIKALIKENRETVTPIPGV